MLTYINLIPDQECNLYNKQHNVHKKYRGFPNFFTKNNLGGTISLIICQTTGWPTDTKVSTQKHLQISQIEILQSNQNLIMDDKRCGSLVNLFQNW